jgi:hypothetical protein
MVWEHQGRKRRGGHTLRVLVAGEGPDEDVRAPEVELAVAARAQPRKGSPVPSPPARDGARGRAACVAAGVPRAPTGRIVPLGGRGRAMAVQCAPPHP